MHNQPPRAWLLLILLALIWGSSFILMKWGLESFTPAQVAALRMLIAALCLFPFVVKRLKEVPRKQAAYLVLAGWLGNGIPAILFTSAQTAISSSLAGVLNGLTPIFALLVGLFAFKAPVKWSQAAGIFLGFVGATAMILISSDGKLDLNGAAYSLLIVLATVLYGINVNIIRYKLNTLDPIVISGTAMLSVGLVYGIYLFSSDFPQRLSEQPNAMISLGSAAILGVFGTAISLVWFNQLVKLSGALFATTCTYLIPFVAVIWGLFAGEKLGWVHLLGLVTILVGVWLVNKK